MSRAPVRLQYWFFKRFLAVAGLVFAALGGVFAVVDLSQRSAGLAKLASEEGAVRTVLLAALYEAMELSIEFLRFPDVVLAIAAGLCMYSIVKSGEAVSVTGLGVSLRRLVLPVMLFLFAFGFGTAVFNEYASYAFAERFEHVRARVWGRRAGERLVFAVPSMGLLCAAEKVLPTGALEGLTVVDAGAGLTVYRADSARYGECGDLQAAGEMPAIYPPDAAGAAGFEARGAPLAALRLARYGAFWVKVSDLLRLRDGRAAAFAGKVLAAGFLLAGLGMLACALMLYNREAPSLAWAVLALLLVEGIVRVAVELAVTYWSPAGMIAGVCWGLAAPLVVFAAGAALLARAPS